MHINSIRIYKGPESCYIVQKLLMVSVTNAKNSVILFNENPLQNAKRSKC